MREPTRTRFDYPGTLVVPLASGGRAKLDALKRRLLDVSAKKLRAAIERQSPR